MSNFGVYCLAKNKKPSCDEQAASGHGQTLNQTLIAGNETIGQSIRITDDNNVLAGTLLETSISAGGFTLPIVTLAAPANDGVSTALPASLSGNVFILSGSTTAPLRTASNDGIAGEINLIGGTAASSGTGAATANRAIGGQIVLTAGDANLAGGVFQRGGEILLEAGNVVGAGASGEGGHIGITAGTGQLEQGGDIDITAGNTDAAAALAGSINITAGDNTGTGSPGNVSISAGDATGNDGGNVFVNGGRSGAGFDGGDVSINGGETQTGIAGRALVIGGEATGAGGTGGQAGIFGGPAPIGGGGIAGDVVLESGNTFGGTEGAVAVQRRATGLLTFFNTPSLAVVQRTSGNSSTAAVAATGVGDVVAITTTFGGYTIGQIVGALQEYGILA